jgi:hypothetical protein
MLRHNKLLTLTLLLFFCLLLFALWLFFLKPTILTRRHASEMHDVLMNYERTVYSIESHQNLALLSQVAQGDSLVYLEKYRCPECPTVPVVVNVNIENLRVLKYSDTHAEVSARIEIATVSASPNTREILSQCRATATEGTFTMAREDGRWKITGGNGQADTWTLPDELQQKVCLEVQNIE